MEEDARQLSESMPRMDQAGQADNKGFKVVESVGMTDEEFEAFNKVAKAEAYAQAARRKAK